jgi:repressor of nif and glnA expression
MKEKEVREIITFQPVSMKIITDPNVTKLLYDENHTPVIIILKHGPMTAEEIQQEYNKMVGKEKSMNTIYYYIKNLEKAGLVIKSGQRMVEGRKATKKLYSRTANNFYATASVD